MKIETELTIISGFVGFSLGVCAMMVVNVNDKYNMYERSIQLDSDTEVLIHENIGDCEDMIEWMNYDEDSTDNEMYVSTLENMVNHNRSILYETNKDLYLQTEYDY